MVIKVLCCILFKYHALLFNFIIGSTDDSDCSDEQNALNKSTFVSLQKYIKLKKKYDIIKRKKQQNEKKLDFYKKNYVRKLSSIIALNLTFL